MLGVPVDMEQVDIGAYVIGITDHITPWRACYGTARLFGPETTFVLANAGHLQSMVNPPGVPRPSSSAARPLRTTRWPGPRAPSRAAGRQLVAALGEWIKGKSGELKPAPTRSSDRANTGPWRQHLEPT